MTDVGGPRRPETSPSTGIEGELELHRSALRAVAASLCRNAAQCDDLVQETFERALRHLQASKEPVRNVRCWLVTILRHVFIDRVRAGRSTTSDVEECPAVEPEPEPPWADITLADVRAALETLDAGMRDVFRLHYLEGLRYREIAVRLGIPENTVASRLSRARKALRDQLLASSREETQGEERARTEP